MERVERVTLPEEDVSSSSSIMIPPPPPRPNREPNERSNDEPEYQVETILLHHDFKVKGTNRTIRYYLVKWDGYMANDSTWEKKSSLLSTTSKKCVDTYEIEYGSSCVVELDDEISNYEVDLSVEYISPPTPIFELKSVDKSEIRVNHRTKKLEMMYLTSYKYLRIKVWETKDTDGLAPLIKKYEARQNAKTGRKRKRTKNTSEDDYEDEEYKSPPEKRRKLNEEESRKGKKSKQKKKKKKKNREFDFKSMSLTCTKDRQDVIFKKKSGRELDIEELEENEQYYSTVVEYLKEGLFAMMENSGLENVTIQFD